jgi:pimeloyl-ACP methyl ester carboxylesterase
MTMSVAPSMRSSSHLRVHNRRGYRRPRPTASTPDDGSVVGACGGHTSLSHQPESQRRDADRWAELHLVCDVVFDARSRLIGSVFAVSYLSTAEIGERRVRVGIVCDFPGMAIEVDKIAGIFAVEGLRCRARNEIAGRELVLIPQHDHEPAHLEKDGLFRFLSLPSERLVELKRSGHIQYAQRKWYAIVMTTSKQVVLVHGMGHGAWCWEPLIADLDASGVDASAVELPLTSLHDDIAALSAALTRYEAPVLVGHSYGGMVITGAGHSASHLVYMAALAPDDGETAMGLGTKYGPSALPDEAVVMSKDGSTASFAPEWATFALYGSCDPATTRTLVEKLRPTSTTCLWTAFKGNPAWRSVPSTYVISTLDRVQQVPLQHDLAVRIGANVVTLDTDHSAYLSRIDDVGALLTQIATTAD